MAIASGMEQSIERARVANALAQMGVAQIAVSDVERLIGEAEQAADLRRQLAAAQTDRAEVLKAIDIVIAERDASHAESDALRRQLATCEAVRLAELALGTQSDAVLERAIAEAGALRRQLAECQEDAPKWLRAQNTQLRRAAQAFEAQLSRTEDERDALRRQVAECQADAERYRAKFQEMEEDWLAERKQVQIITEDRDYLLRQLAECAGTDSTVPMLQRIKVAVDSILDGLDPNEFDEPINWGDLYAASVSFRIDDDGRVSTVVEIEEAAPGCEKLCATVAQRLSMLGWQNVAVDTEW